MANQKRVIIFCTIFLNLGINSIAQQFTGFKKTDAGVVFDSDLKTQLYMRFHKGILHLKMNISTYSIFVQI